MTRFEDTLRERPNAVWVGTFGATVDISAAERDAIVDALAALRHLQNHWPQTYAESVPEHPLTRSRAALARLDAGVSE